MLLEFSVENHRSFATEQTFTLVASRSDDGHPERIAVVDGQQKIQVLTTAIIMGKNGSGKSSLVDAMRFARRLVLNSVSDGQPKQQIDRSPYSLEKSIEARPSSYRILFSVKSVIYQFSFSIVNERVVRETLEVSDRTARFRKLYDRFYDSDLGEYRYSFGDALRGDKESWRRATRETSLFLTTAVKLNSNALSEPYEWLTTFLRVIDAANGNFGNYTSSHCVDETNKSNVIEFLRSLDINIDDIIIEEDDIVEALTKALNPELIKEMLSNDPRIFKQHRVQFVHRVSNDTTAPLDLIEESTGTKALFGLAGPLFDSLANGYCLVVDEINTSLHPKILHALVGVFSDPKINRKRAQLIFTSHDVSVLRDQFFRRDQIWFVEKDKAQSVLVPLTDYSPRKGEALEKGYLDGRYGGIPFTHAPLSLKQAGVIWNDVDGEME